MLCDAVVGRSVRVVKWNEPVRLPVHYNLQAYIVGASVSEEDLDRLIEKLVAEAGPVSVKEVGPVPATEGRGGRPPAWPWDSIAFLAGQWVRAGRETGRETPNTAMAQYVRGEAKRLTGREPHEKYCEQKIREWKKTVEEN